jgi:hypothetical protein
MSNVKDLQNATRQFFIFHREAREAEERQSDVTTSFLVPLRYFCFAKTKGIK